MLDMQTVIGAMEKQIITIEAIREKLFLQKVKVLPHAIESMFKRGYTREDLIHAIMYGEITTEQFIYGQNRYVVESVDVDFNPIVLIVTQDREQPDFYAVITVFPPIKEKFKHRINEQRKVVA